MRAYSSTPHKFSVSGRKVKALEGFALDADEFVAKNQLKKLNDLGLITGLDNAKIAKYAKYYADHQGASIGMDSLQPLITTPSIVTPVQFLQNWIPGLVKIITAPLKADLLIGYRVTGKWHDEQIVQGVLEEVGTSTPYGDVSKTNAQNLNANWVYRTVVRFESGIQVGPLEELRSGEVRIDTASTKRSSAAKALAIRMNQIAFYGYNDGLGLTYGILTDPALPPYFTAANGVVSGTPLWATKTMQEITADIRQMLAYITAQSLDYIDVDTTPLTLAVASDVKVYLSTISDFGYSVLNWLKDNYPNIRVQSAPEFNGANSGANVAYLYADRVDDDSTDDGRVFAQNIQSRFQVLGVQKLTKGYKESYSNGTAGTMVVRPYAVSRITGI